MPLLIPGFQLQHPVLGVRIPVPCHVSRSLYLLLRFIRCFSGNPLLLLSDLISDSTAFRFQSPLSDSFPDRTVNRSIYFPSKIYEAVKAFEFHYPSWLKSQKAIPNLYAMNLSFTPATIRSAFCFTSSSASSRGFASSTMTVPSLTE